jgi:hypothetical protein
VTYFRGQVVSTPVSYFGGLAFKSLSGYRLSYLRFFVVSLSSPIIQSQLLKVSFSKPKIFFTHVLYIICRICNKCICSISTGSWMSYAQWRNSYNYFCSLRYHFNSCTGALLRSVCLSVSLCAVSLLSSRFNASALVWFLIFLSIWYSNFLFHWALCLCINLHGSCGCLCTKVPSMDRTALDWKRFRL